MATKKESIRNILLDIRGMLKWFFSGEGALITLTLLIIAAIIAYLIQDAIQRQRYLELLELELRANYNAANNEVKNVNEHKYLYFHIPFHSGVYNAGLQQGYLITLDPNTQAELYAFYNSFLPGENALIQKNMDIINEYEADWEHCIINNDVLSANTTICDPEHKKYLQVQTLYSSFIAQSDVLVWQNIKKINFNPTENRLHPKNLGDLLLRIIMGNESLKIQQNNFQ